MDVTAELRRVAVTSVIGDVRTWVAQTQWGMPIELPEQPLPAGLKPHVLVSGAGPAARSSGGGGHPAGVRRNDTSR